MQNGSNSPLSEEEEERDPDLYDTFVSPLSLQAAFRASGAVRTHYINSFILFSHSARCVKQ